MIDLAALLAPSSQEAPSGPEVETDPEYHDLQQAARRVLQEKDAQGKEIREAKEPNWPEVERLALVLCARSKDLRVAIHLANAKLALEGLPGFASALELLKGYVVQFWPSVHPQLDPDDSHDPKIRVNILSALCDAETVMRGVRTAPLSQSKQFGRISWRDYAIAHGELRSGPDAKGQPDLARIEAALADTPLEFLQQTQAAAAGSIQQLVELDTSLQASLGVGIGPDFEPLRRQLGEIKSMLDNEAAKRGGGEAAPPPTETGIVVSGAIRSRGDVVATLDRICQYYREYEPSSPIPLILERTKRLVPMGFLDILKELTPEGVKKFGLIAGIKVED
jgi:type VI secretion system protein ImpA